MTEFQSYLEERLKIPEVRAGYEAEALADVLRRHGMVVWERRSMVYQHAHVITEPRRESGQTARRYRARRRAWRRFQDWQRRVQRRRETTS